jgi:isopropylmalate/homocitrate/citramalate synthase
VPPSALPQLKELSQFVDEIANFRHNPRQPWVGSAAFAHKGGTHVNAVQKIFRSYEHIDPASVGNTRNVLISDLAGRSNIVMKARELGIELSNDAPELREILARVKALEHQGYEFEAAGGSLAVLIRKILQHQALPVEVKAITSPCASKANRPFARRRSRCRSMASRPIPWPRATGRSTRWTRPCAARWPVFIRRSKHPADRLQGPYS